MGTGPSLLARPHSPSPTTLFPACPSPNDASDVTANNLDFNQEVTPPTPCPTYGLTKEKTQTSIPGQVETGPAPNLAHVPPPTPLLASQLPTPSPNSNTHGRERQGTLMAEGLPLVPHGMPEPAPWPQRDTAPV